MKLLGTDFCYYFTRKIFCWEISPCTHYGEISVYHIEHSSFLKGFSNNWMYLVCVQSRNNHFTNQNIYDIYSPSGKLLVMALQKGLVLWVLRICDFFLFLSDHSSDFSLKFDYFFWHCISPIGVLEANFLEPVHDKQGFERSSVFIRLETRLKQMVMEYWYVKFLTFLSLLSKCIWISSRIFYQIISTFFLPYNFN